MTKITQSYVCWKCGASIESQPLPLSRTAECQSCSADLCVCKMCSFYDVSVAKSCRETVADEVNDKQRANFCDYFSLQADAYHPNDLKAADAAQAELEKLFGLNSKESKQDDKEIISPEQSTRDALDDLFKK